VAYPPTPLPGIRVTTIKILGVTLTNSLSVAEHVHAVISSSALTLYALRVLRAHGMDDVSLPTIYRSVVIAKLTDICLHGWWGFASTSDLQRLEVIVVVLCQLSSQHLLICIRTPVKNCLVPSPATAIMFYTIPPFASLSRISTLRPGNVHTTSPHL